jgi:L-lactate utilization protein LutC
MSPFSPINEAAASAQGGKGSRGCSRENILHKVRTALGRSAEQPLPAMPEPWLRTPDWDVDRRILQFRAALEKLNGKTHRASSMEDARSYAAQLIAGQAAVASNAPFLERCGVLTLEGVRSGFTDARELRDACATANVGITSADYALADTGSLVMFSSREEARLISLLPPVHLALVPTERLLTGLDELFTQIPDPAVLSSSMVLITGPSRTADIEQILVRGVHGPGEIHVVLV